MEEAPEHEPNGAFHMEETPEHEPSK